MRALHLAGVNASETTDRPLRKDAERNRTRVLEAARDLFASKGLEPNLNDVAHHAGVGVGTVYRRFATKEELLEAIFEDGINQLADLAESALCQPDSWQGFVWYVEQMCVRSPRPTEGCGRSSSARRTGVTESLPPRTDWFPF